MTAGNLKVVQKSDPVWETKVHLAAALRLAVRDELEEGIDNHFTVMVPGYTDRFMISPFGLHWSEARASDMMIFNEQGEIFEGKGKLEISALCIHAPVHRLTGAKVVLHTHQTWALALNMLKDNRLLPASQTAAFICNTTAYDDTYTGLAHSLNEGERLSKVMGNKKVLFMKNHGVMVLGDTIAEAYKRLYRLERVCRAQVLAMGTGKELELLSDEVVNSVRHDGKVNSHTQEERDELYFSAMMRVLDRENPGYAD